MSRTPSRAGGAASPTRPGGGAPTLHPPCRFMAPDPFVYLEVGGRKILLMSDLEVDRARRQARVDEVLSLSEWEAKAKQRWAQPRLTHTLSLLLEDYGRATTE